jgi:histidyl-tRNA synthetase
MSEKPIQAVKGMNDILPPESARWEWFEDTVRALMRRYGYLNVRTPDRRAHAAVRARAGRGHRHRREGDVLLRRQHERRPLTLRPEGTAGVVRAVIEHNTAVRRRQAAVLHRADVPPRAAAARAATASSTRSVSRRWALAARTSTPR